MNKQFTAGSTLELEPPQPLPRPTPLRPSPSPIPQIRTKATTQPAFQILLREDWN